MAGTNIQGSQLIDTVSPSVIRPGSFQDKIMKLRPQESAVLSVLMALKKLDVDDMEFNVFGQNNRQFVTALTAAASQSDTTITVTAGTAALFRVGSLFRVASGSTNFGEVFRVTAVNTGANQLDITPAVPAGGIPISTKILLYGDASPEFSEAPTPFSLDPVVETNYIQTQRDTWGASNMVNSTRFYGGDRYWHYEEDANWEHKAKMNRALLFGKKEKTTDANGKRLYMTGGFFDLIKETEAFSANQVTWSKVNAFSKETFRYGSTTKMLVISRLVASIFGDLQFGKSTPDQFINDTFGVRLCNNLETPHGNFKMVIDDSLREGYEGRIIVVDPKYVDIVTTKDRVSGKRRFLMKEDNVQLPGVDGKVSCVTSDFGLRIHGASTDYTDASPHSIWTGALAAA